MDLNSVVDRISTMRSPKIRAYCESDPEVNRLCQDREFWTTMAIERMGLPLLYNKGLPAIDFAFMNFDYQKWPDRLIVPVIEAGLFELVPTLILRSDLRNLESNKHNVISAALPSMPAPIFRSMIEAYRQKGLYWGSPGTVGTMSVVLANAFYMAIEMGRDDIAEVISPEKLARFSAFIDAVRMGQIDSGRDLIRTFIHRDAFS